MNKKNWIEVTLLLLAVSNYTQAATLNFSPVDTGVFTFTSSSIGISSGSAVSHDPGQTGIGFSASIGGGVSSDTNAFAIYDLTGLSGQVVSGSWSLTLATNNVAIGIPGSFTFNEVTTDASNFNQAYNERSSCTLGIPCDLFGTGLAIYNDLGDGPSLGTLNYTDSGTQSTPLNSGALSSAESALGGFLVVGLNSDSLGLGSVSFDPPQLTLEVIPEPSSASTLGAGLMVLLLRRTRRRRR